jgi:hypothetical protein
MNKQGVAALAAVAMIALAGCSAGGDGGSGDAPPTPETKDVSYATIDEFRDAVVDAGVDCSGFSERTGMAHAAAGADCSSATVIMIFSSESQRDEQVATLKSFAVDDEGRPLLVGPNWVVNGGIGDLEKLQAAIGGMIDTSMPN